MDRFEVQKVRVQLPAAQIGPLSNIERKAIIGRADLRLRRHHASATDSDPSHRFTRRMLAAREIDAGQESTPEPYHPGLYLKHVPTIDVAAQKRAAGIMRQFVGIAAWGAVSKGVGGRWLDLTPSGKRAIAFTQ